jgi:hypothetical protein
LTPPGELNLPAEPLANSARPDAGTAHISRVALSLGKTTRQQIPSNVRMPPQSHSRSFAPPREWLRWMKDQSPPERIFHCEVLYSPRKSHSLTHVWLA